MSALYKQSDSHGQRHEGQPVDLSRRDDARADSGLGAAEVPKVARQLTATGRFWHWQVEDRGGRHEDAGV